ncbi:MAG: Fe2+-dependent dioxygenase [Pseudomonadota bacterium]
MLVTVSNLLDADQLALITGLIDGLEWHDGAKTAGITARQVKRNRQADLTSRLGETVDQHLQKAIESHPVIKAAASPKHFSPRLISQTGPGGGYGFHIDNAFMGALRTDLSYTLFLSPPDAYKGGELVIEHGGLTHRLKPDAGDLVLYPATSLHQVAEVTSGQRLVCVGWIQSHVAEAEAREILFDLHNLRASLAASYGNQSPEMLTLSKVMANLLRLTARG